MVTHAIRLTMLWIVAPVCLDAVFGPTAAMAQAPSATLPAGSSAGRPAKVEPVLEPDRELMARIEALPDNTWLKLPPIKTTGDMGVLNRDPDYKRLGPFVRDYCNKMVWAPERKRVLYCGGGHNVHPFNDVWEYDLPSNTWVCLYGADPVPPRTKPGEEDKAVAWYKAHAILKDGSVRTPRGAPLRPCHTWWSLAYDSDKRRMLFLESHKGFFGVDKVSLAKALNIDPKDPLLRGSGSGAGEAWLFSFSPETRQWTEVLTKVPKAYESAYLEYLSGAKTVWWTSGKTYRLDEATHQWIVYPATGIAGFPSGGETAYDAESRKIVAAVNNATFVFSVDTNRWERMQEKAPCRSRVPRSTFCYDSTARRFVLYTHAGGPPKVWLYDLATNEWSDPNPQGETPKVSNVAGYYDAARNVMVIYSNRETWVYRCKKRAK